jgi:hypothetical protein
MHNASACNRPRTNRRAAARFPCSTLLATSLAVALGLGASTADAKNHRLLRDSRATTVDLAALVPAYVRTSKTWDPNHPTGATHQVTSCKDDGTADTLRSVINDAQTVSGDTIVLAPMACSKITLSQNQPIRVTQDKLYIQGPGADSLSIDGDGQSSVLYHTGNSTLYVSGVTIEGGHSTTAFGGCIYSAASVFLLDAVVAGCVVDTSASGNFGGGVFTMRDLTLVDSVVTNNEVFSFSGNAYGGGAYVEGSFFAHASTVSDNFASSVSGTSKVGGVLVVGSTTDIEGTTVSGNSAEVFGAIALLGGGNAVIFNSTISGNLATHQYGGVITSAALTLANSTIAFNRSNSTASNGNGLYAGAPLTLHSSIIADNTGPIGSTDLGGPIGLPVTGTDNLVVSSGIALPLGNSIGVCPKLDMLADNDGPTQTIGLHENSPAIDHGNATGAGTDQRGRPRISGAGTDMGAFERQPDDKDERFLASGFDGFCDQ